MTWLIDSIVRLAGPLALVAVFALPPRRRCCTGGALVTAAGPHPEGRATAERRQPDCSRATAAAIWDRWVSAWGKFPSSVPVAGSNSSANSPRSLAVADARS
jgi:hypothetical protein